MCVELVGEAAGGEGGSSPRADIEVILYEGLLFIPNDFLLLLTITVK